MLLCYTTKQKTRKKTNKNKWRKQWKYYSHYSGLQCSTPILCRCIETSTTNVANGAAIDHAKGQRTGANFLLRRIGTPCLHIEWMQSQRRQVSKVPTHRPGTNLPILSAAPPTTPLPQQKQRKAKDATATMVGVSAHTFSSRPRGWAQGYTARSIAQGRVPHQWHWHIRAINHTDHDRAIWTATAFRTPKSWLWPTTIGKMRSLHDNKISKSTTCNQWGGLLYPDDYGPMTNLYG